eukprot:scaffold3466_cov132-Isochrysis_galbana.AAC.7
MRWTPLSSSGSASDYRMSKMCPLPRLMPTVGAEVVSALGSFGLADAFTLGGLAWPVAAGFTGSASAARLPRGPPQSSNAWVMAWCTAPSARWRPCSSTSAAAGLSPSACSAWPHRRYPLAKRGASRMHSCAASSAGLSRPHLRRAAARFEKCRWADGSRSHARS